MDSDLNTISRRIIELQIEHRDRRLPIMTSCSGAVSRSAA